MSFLGDSNGRATTARVSEPRTPRAPSGGDARFGRRSGSERLRALAVVATLALWSGCISLVSEGKVGEREVRLDGTGFAWLDDTVYESGPSGAELKSRESDDVTLHLVFSSAVFDPNVDFRALPAPERLRVVDEVQRGDLLRLAIRRGDRLLAGDKLSYRKGSELPAATPYLSTPQLVIGSPPLARDADYPDAVGYRARALEVDLEIHGVGPRVLGTAEVRVRREDESDDGAEGDLSLRFDVERVAERVAECNFAPDRAGASVDPCAALSFSEP